MSVRNSIKIINAILKRCICANFYVNNIIVRSDVGKNNCQKRQMVCQPEDFGGAKYAPPKIRPIGEVEAVIWRSSLLALAACVDIMTRGTNITFKYGVKIIHGLWCYNIIASYNIVVVNTRF